MADTYEDLERMFVKADAAGDIDAARMFVQEMDRMRPPKAKEPDHTFMGDLGDEFLKAGKNVATGVVQGVGGIPDLIGMIPGMEETSKRMGSKAMMSGLKDIGVDISVPEETKGTLARYLQNTLQFGGGALAGPGGAQVKAVQAILGGGLGSLGEQAVGDLGKLGGELAAGAGMVVGRGRKPNAAKMVQGDLQEFSPEEWAAAAAQTKKDKAAGVDTLITQALPRAGGIEEQVEALASSRQGKPLRKKFAEQLVDAITVGRKGVDELSDLPLTAETANRVSAAGKNVVDEPGRWRAQRDAPHYAKLDQPVSPGMTDYLAAKVAEQRRAVGFAPTTPQGKVIDKTARDLQKTQKQADLDMEDVNLRELADIGRTNRQMAHDATEGVGIDPKMRAKAKGLRVAGNTIMDELNQVYPEVGQADAAHRMYSKPFKEMQESGLPKIFTGEPVQDMKGFTGILDKDEKTVRRTAAAFNKQDPAAFPAIVKQEWSDALDKAQSVAKEGRVAQSAPIDFVSAIAGTPESRARALVAVEEVAKSKGGDPVSARAGAEALFDALTNASHGRKGVGRTDIGANAAEGASNWGTALRSFGFAPMWSVANMLDNTFASKTNKKVVEALLSPDVLAKLNEIAQHSTGKETSKAILSAVMSVQGGRDQNLDSLSSIDTTRPILENKDGSFSTERTITIESDGKHYLLPTIVNGKQVSSEEAVKLWRERKNKTVGTYDSAIDADLAAVQRSKKIGEIREKDRK